MSKPNTRMLMGGHGTAVGYQVFTTSGVWNWGMAGAPETVDVLVVGGGGSSGLSLEVNGSILRGGGGGPGEIVTRFDFPVSGDVEVIVGAGGTIPDPGTYPYTRNPRPGESSRFGPEVVARGGGRGGGAVRKLWQQPNELIVQNGSLGSGGSGGNIGTGAGSPGWPGTFKDGDAGTLQAGGSSAGYGTTLGILIEDLGFGGIPGTPSRLAGVSGTGFARGGPNTGFGGTATAPPPSGSGSYRPGSSGLVVVRWGS